MTLPKWGTRFDARSARAKSHLILSQIVDPFWYRENCFGAYMRRRSRIPFVASVEVTVPVCFSFQHEDGSRGPRHLREEQRERHLQEELQSSCEIQFLAEVSSNGMFYVHGSGILPKFICKEVFAKYMISCSRPTGTPGTSWSS